ncbi:MAG: serpin family protein [Saccharofermentanales bacterium]|jgi:serine protease inhibitor
MKLNDLQDAMGQIDDSLVTEAGRDRGKKKPPLWNKIGAVAAAIALVLTSFIIIQGTRRHKNNNRSDVMALTSPEYPVIHMHPSEDLLSGSKSDQEAYDKAYSAWSDDFQRQRNQPQGYNDGVVTLTRKANRLLLTTDGENRVYSPLNIYLSLSLMAETTGGDTREEILQVLGVDTIETLREKAGSLWQAHYMNDGQTTSLLANSIWFDNALSIKKETMKILQDVYKASAFQGDMSSAAMTEQLQKWLNEQTDNLLESSVDNAGFDKDTLMALASTILFRAKWNDEFNEGNTGKSTFHSPAGSIETDFMSESSTNIYYWGDNFAAIGKGMTYSGNMWFFLPDEGVNVNELLDDPQVDAILQNSVDYEHQKFLIVNFKVPKFDVMSEIQLGEAMQDLGITKAFTASADFSPTSEDAGLFVSDASHAARVMIDEKGVTGAAYTLIFCGAAMPPDETVDFVLDRPFLFVVQGHDGVPLFVGVVNHP